MSKLERWSSGMSRAAMEQMSTNSLEKMLQDDYYSLEYGESDMDKLYMAAQILEERRLDQCNSTNLAWEHFQESYFPFIVMLSEDGDAPSSDDALGRRHSPLRQWPVWGALTAKRSCALALFISVVAAIIKLFIVLLF